MSERDAATMEVAVYLGVGENFHYRPYRPGKHQLWRAFTYQIVVPVPDGVEVGFDLDGLAERAFHLFNLGPDEVLAFDPDDMAGALLCAAYRQAGCRSLSCGDVLVFGEIALSCESAGWDRVAIAAADVVADRIDW